MSRFADSPHRSLLTTTGALLATTVVTSALGFAYWWAAARLLTPSQVGVGSSTVSAMSLAGTVGMLGLGTMLIGELASRREGRQGLVTASVLAAAGASAVIGLVIVVIFINLGRAPFAGPDWTSISWFVAGAAITGSSLVLDLALVGSQAGGRQLLRNAIFAAVKLAILSLVISWTPHRYGVGVLIAWVLGSAVSLAVVVPKFGPQRAAILGRPTWRELASDAESRRRTMRSTWRVRYRGSSYRSSQPCSSPARRGAPSSWRG